MSSSKKRKFMDYNERIPLLDRYNALRVVCKQQILFNELLKDEINDLKEALRKMSKQRTILLEKLTNLSKFVSDNRQGLHHLEESSSFNKLDFSKSQHPGNEVLPMTLEGNTSSHTVIETQHARDLLYAAEFEYNSNTCDVNSINTNSPCSSDNISSNVVKIYSPSSVRERLTSALGRGSIQLPNLVESLYQPSASIDSMVDQFEEPPVIYSSRNRNVTRRNLISTRPLPPEASWRVSRLTPSPRIITTHEVTGCGQVEGAQDCPSTQGISKAASLCLSEASQGTRFYIHKLNPANISGLYPSNHTSSNKQ